MENTFDPTTHTYAISGRKVPSVTQVLSDLLPCYQAGEWYLQRGTAVHACAAMVAQGVEFDHDPQISGQVAACRRFFTEVKPEVMQCETVIYSETYGFAGTYDLLCAIGGRIMVLDWKASISQSVPYQLAAYALAIEGKSNGCLVKHGIGVQLNDDGTYNMTKVFSLGRYKQGFLSLLSAYNIRRECKVKEEGIRE